MLRLLMFVALSYLILFSCKSKTTSLPEQLKTNYLSHLKKIDSTIGLDSFILERIDTIDRRMERIIDDTIYTREFTRVQNQLTNAVIEKREDSIEFYQGEVNYMVTQFDSLKKEISTADTTKKLGLLVVCKVHIRKHNKNQVGVVYYFLDWNGTVWNSDMIDTSISFLNKRFN